MKETKRVWCNSRSSNTHKAERKKMPIGFEAPVFQAIPDTAPLTAVKAGVTAAILPWCC